MEKISTVAPSSRIEEELEEEEEGKRLLNYEDANQSSTLPSALTSLGTHSIFSSLKTWLCCVSALFSPSQTARFGPDSLVILGIDQCVGPVLGLKHILKLVWYADRRTLKRCGLERVQVRVLCLVSLGV